MNTRPWGFTPCWYSAAPPALRPAVLLAISLMLATSGCKQAAPITEPHLQSTTGIQYPPRPTTPPPPFKVFHHDASSFTLVTKQDATDTDIEAILWQLHDAARAHAFDHLKIDQKVIDARDPIVWFHLYRGPKCASEKYTTAKLPCGASYHAAGDYTFGGFKDSQHDDAVLLHDEDHEIRLWNPDAPPSLIPVP
jgi:hypothetical protein